MKIAGLLLIIFILFFHAPVAKATSFEDETTPIEKGDFETIGQVNDGDEEGEATPIEEEDFETIDQINDGDEEGKATPIEQEDFKTIDQINNY